MGPYLVIFPIILQTIAGKNVRDILYRQVTLENGNKERIYNEAAQIHLPFLDENVHLPFIVGWCIYFIIPMSIALFCALYFYRKHQTQSCDPTFVGNALMIMGWLFFYLNWAFLGYPWPWEGWGSWPWQKWGGPSSTATFFLISMIALTAMVIKENKQDAEFDDTN
jgi:apolipoprotein N-acyltransferase